MKKHEKTVHEPLCHIAKRGGLLWWKAWLIRLAAVAVALILVGFITVLVTKKNPFEVYAAMWAGSFSTPRRVWTMLQSLAMLLCVSLAVTPAFRMRFWNIGAEGQVLVGGMATAACMILCGNKLPSGLLMLLILVCSVLAGIIWAVIPAVFKAYWNTNETLFTLMMNYIAIQIVAYFSHIWAVPKGSGKIGMINADTQAGWLPAIFGQKYLLSILIVLGLTIFMYIYLRYSKHGYEISVVGESENTARYIGIPVKKVIIRTVMLSGALCGLAGMLLVSGADHTVNRDTAGGRGFTAIMVSWLGKFNPLYMILTSFLLVFLEKGAGEISTQCGLNASFSDIITGIIIFFIIGSEFFINYTVKFRHSQKEGAAA